MGNSLTRSLLDLFILFRQLSTASWPSLGTYTSTLSKGPYTTTWIWNLHALPHDYDSHYNTTLSRDTKIFASSLAHIALLFFWLSGMLFHSGYFSNYSLWLLDP